MAQKVYDENDAILFMRNHTTDELKDKYSSNDMLLLIDAMFDYDEANSGHEDFDPTVDEIVAYVAKQLRKDTGNAIQPQDVKALVEAELQYELSLEED